VLDLFEFEAVPAKQSLDNIHLWQQVRITHIVCVLLNKYSRENQEKKTKENHKTSAAAAEITIT